MKSKISRFLCCVLVLTLCFCTACKKEKNPAEGGASSGGDHQTEQPEQTDDRALITAPVDTDALDAYMIADFESYRELSQMRFISDLGKVSENTDAQFVKTGKQSMKIEIEGRDFENRDGTTFPGFEIYSTSTCVQKDDFRGYNEYRMSVYNAMDYDLYIRFTLLGTSRYFTLQSGWNEIAADIAPAFYNGIDGTRTVEKFRFFFDRGEQYEQKNVVYVDNFRAVKTRSIEAKPSWSIGEDGILNGFNDLSALNQIQAKVFAGSGVEVGIELETDPKYVTEGKAALRIHGLNFRSVRTDVMDEYRFALVHPELIKGDWTEYADKHASFDIMNDGAQPIEINVYYFWDTGARPTHDVLRLEPGARTTWKQLMSVLGTAAINGASMGGLEVWPGIALGFPVPHEDQGRKPFNVVIDNFKIS